MRRTLVILAALAACSPAEPPPGVIGGRNPVFAPSSSAAAPIVQLDALPRNGRVEVAVGQAMQFRTRYSSSQGEVVERGAVPDFVDYIGVEVSAADPGASADHVFIFVARRPGEGVLTMQQYNQRFGGPPGYEVLNVTVVAR